MKTARILLIEDNAADIELVREALSSVDLKHVLDVATDFEQARNYMEKLSDEGRPDIVLVDLNLPQGSGLELLRLFRNQPYCQDIPAIVVSSSNSPRERDTVAALGGIVYFRKPIDLYEFMKLGPLVVQSLKDPLSG